MAVTFIIISVLLLMVVFYQHYYFTRRINTIETTSKDLEMEARKTLQDLDDEKNVKKNY